MITGINALLGAWVLITILFVMMIFITDEKDHILRLRMIAVYSVITALFVIIAYGVNT